MTFIAKRAAQLLLVLIAVTALTYFAQNLLPGDIAVINCATAGQQCIDQQREELHLNDPAPVRYLRWLKDAATGDLGRSGNTKEEVKEALGQRAPVTFALVVYSQLIALAVAIPIGLLAAQKVGTSFDRTSTGCAFGLLAIPAFIAAPPLVALFAVQLHWFSAAPDVSGLDMWVLLGQIILIAALVSIAIYLSQLAGPPLADKSALVRLMVIVETVVAILGVTALAFSALNTLFGIVAGVVVGGLAGAGLAALAFRSISSMEFDEDASGRASIAVLVGIGYLVVAVLMILKMAFPSSSGSTSGVGKLVNQGLFDVKGLFLPSVVLAIAEMATYMRLLRSDMISTLQEDYITMAKAKGLAPRAVMMKHAFRPSTFSLITVAGLNFGRLIGGTLIVEMFFALPGIGKYLVEASLRRDYVAVQGAIVLITVCYVGVVFLLDAVYALLDPRIRHARVVV